MAKKPKHYQILDPVIRSREDNMPLLHADPEPIAVAVKPEPATDWSPDEEPEYRFWPKGKPLPACIRKVKREILPCPHCLRIFLTNGGQAMACLHSDAQMAYYRCRSCGRTSKIRVETV
jgi:hypothetical protein